MSVVINESNKPSRTQNVWILEGPRTSVCVNLKGDVSFFISYWKGHTMVFYKLTNLTMKIIRFSFAKKCGKHFFQDEEKWVPQPFVP